MPSGLKRYYGAGHFHFITCSCYQRRPLLWHERWRDFFIELLEQSRQRYRFVVAGYVIMPEHFHLLMSEPEKEDASVVMKVVKQEFARRVLREMRRRRMPQARVPQVRVPHSFRAFSFGEMSGLQIGGEDHETEGGIWHDALEAGHVWQPRFYDFNVWSERKRAEKLRYMHQNPVTRGLVPEPEQWRWSSFRAYTFGEPGPVRLNESWPIRLSIRKVGAA